VKGERRMESKSKKRGKGRKGMKETEKIERKETTSLSV
jgi:hypothetical protein